MKCGDVYNKMEMNNKNKKKLGSEALTSNILEWLLFFYLIVNHLHYIFNFEGYYKLFAVGLINAIGIVFFIYVVYTYKNYKIFLFALLMFFVGMLTKTISNNADIIVYLTMFRFIGVACYVFLEKRNKKIVTGMMYITLLLFSPLLIAPLGFTMFMSASRNYYSIILLMANYVYNDIFIKENKPIILAPTFISFFIVSLSGSRSGILSYLIFTTGVLIADYQIANFQEKNKRVLISKKRKTIIKDVFLVIILIGAFFIKSSLQDNYRNSSWSKFFNYYEIEKNPEMLEEYNVLSDAEKELIKNNRFIDDFGFSDKGFTETGRIKMIRLYLEETSSNLKSIFFSFPITNVPYYAKFNFNLHNSYLKLHSQYSLIGFTSFFILGLNSLYMLLTRKKWGLLIILLGVCFRAFLDSAAFPGHLDLILYGFLLYPFMSDKQENIFSYSTIIE